MLLLLAEQYPTVQVKILHSVTVFFSFFFFFLFKDGLWTNQDWLT